MTGLVALVLDDLDAEQFRDEHPELADETIIIIAGNQGWAALNGIVPTTVTLGYAAGLTGGIGGTNPPRHVRLALTVAAHRAPAYLQAHAHG